MYTLSNGGIIGTEAPRTRRKVAGLSGNQSRLHNSDSTTHMKKNPIDQRDWHERRIEEARKSAGAEKPAKGNAKKATKSRKAAPRQKRKTGAVGLANEPRPGLGTRRNDTDPIRALEDVADDSAGNSQPKATKRAYEEPRPDPREQASDSRAHDEERSTGVSGQSSGA